MKSPLTLDKETVKKYNIPEDIELSPRQKLAFLEAQLHQIQAVHFRARIDMLHATRLQEEENPTLQEKGLSNMATHRNEMQQTIGAIAMLTKLIEELRAEYPQLGNVNAADHPEGF